MQSHSNKKSLMPTVAISSIVMVFLGILIYYPGLHGPLVFDDFANIIVNESLRIRELNTQSLYHAAFSTQTGPLSRPISMVSFALNYYFTGSFADSFALKLTNVLIHIINGLLVFWLMHSVIRRVAALSDGLYQFMSDRSHLLLAVACGLMWLVHPIQLTSVLYIIQRMTELSAFFVLLALICYFQGRLRLLSGRRDGIWLILFGLLGFGTLGLFSKENAALLPLFVVLMEYLLFAKEAPWTLWSGLSVTLRRSLLAMLLLALAAFAVWILQYALNGYSSRDFGMYERVITEPRVLMFYISLILLPRLNQFGLYHDDIPISYSLLSPWTTIPALLLAGLIALAFYTRKRHVLISLGIFWFLIGHALESTIFDLEIAHEHRNYLASLGILLAFAHLIVWTYKKINNRAILLVLPMLVLLFSFNTYLRSTQWENLYTLMYLEAEHHPKSPRVHADYSAILFTAKKYNSSMKHMRTAASLDPNEPGYYINMHIISFGSGIKLTAKEEQATLLLIRKKPRSLLLQQALFRIDRCLVRECSKMAPKMKIWLTTLLENRSIGDHNLSLYYYMLGRTYRMLGNEKISIKNLMQSYKLDPNYMHPMFEQAYIYIDQRNEKSAEKILVLIEKTNKNHAQPKHQDIAELKARIKKTWPE